MALTFDGTDDKVDHGDIDAIDGTAALTVGVWAWLDTSDTSRREFWGKGLSPIMYGTNFGAGGTNIVEVSGSDFGTVAAAITAQVWEYHAVVYDGSLGTNADRMKLFRNLSPLTVAFTGTIPATLTGSATVFTFGSTNGSHFWKGHLAFGRIWTAALSIEELAREMWSYVPVRAANLILDSPYDDETARDYSGAANHGTITGATLVGGPPGINYGTRVLTPRGRRTMHSLRAARVPALRRTAYGLGL